MILVFIYSLLLIFQTGAIDPPPPHNEVALMARYIMHESAWLSLATISTQKNITGYPFVTLKSISDGPQSNATGVPYLYMTEMDVSGRDVKSNNRVTIMASLAETDYCRNEDYDPQDPRCAKLIISGRYRKIPEDSWEFKFGRDALFDKHPAMKSWPADHGFYVATITMEIIEVLDYFGGIKQVSINDYFNANITNIININSYFDRVTVIQSAN